MRSYRRGPQRLPGECVEYHGANLPAGYLWADGSEYDTARYPRLAAALGPEYATGAGRFRVPDRRDRVAVGAGSRPRGATFGAASRTPSVAVTVNNHTLTESQIPSHGSHVGAAGSGNLVNDNGMRALVSKGGSGAHAHGATATAQPIDLHQPSIACNFIIKT